MVEPEAVPGLLNIATLFRTLGSAWSASNISILSRYKNHKILVSTACDGASMRRHSPSPTQVGKITASDKSQIHIGDNYTNSGGRPVSHVFTLPYATEAAFNSRHNQYDSACLKNTRAELLRDIEEWVASPDERFIFWLAGMAGTGKSTVARTISRTYYDRGMLGGSFFFSSGGGDRSNANKFVTSLARQLATAVPSLEPYISDAIRTQDNIIETTLYDQWDKLIINPLSRLNSNLAISTILFVIDALDECTSVKDITIIQKVLATAGVLGNIRLRILITSRPDIVVRPHFQGTREAGHKVFVLHDIPSSVVDRDLRTFFEHELYAIRRERDLDDSWPGNHVIQYLVKLSHGLFIWASTACLFIREGKQLVLARTQKLIQGSYIADGPEKQLDQIYTTVLQHSIQQDADEEEKQDVCFVLRDVLGTILTLFSPLPVASLARLLDKGLNYVKNALADLHPIMNVPDRKYEPIRLHHPTFRDFLLNQERCRDVNFRVDAAQVHKALAERCISIMSKSLEKNICHLKSPGELASDVDRGQVKKRITAELEYACLYWVHHCRQSGMRLRDGDTFHEFFKGYFLYWLETISLLGKSDEMGAIIRLYHSILVVCILYVLLWSVQLLICTV